MRAPLKLFGLSDELEIAVPWGFGAFAVRGGASAYFHGGMSLQELIVPVVTLRTQRKEAPIQMIQWTLRPGSRKISTRIFSVLITGSIQAGGMFEVESSLCGAWRSLSE